MAYKLKVGYLIIDDQGKVYASGCATFGFTHISQLNELGYWVRLICDKKGMIIVDKHGSGYYIGDMAEYRITKLDVPPYAFIPNPPRLKSPATSST